MNNLKSFDESFLYNYNQRIEIDLEELKTILFN